MKRGRKHGPQQGMSLRETSTEMSETVKLG